MRGNVISSYRWISANTSYYNYDLKNKHAFPTSVTNGMNQTTTILYDYRAGKAPSVTDPLNNTTTYAYNDAFDRVTRMTQPSLAQTNIAYVTPNWGTGLGRRTTAANPKHFEGKAEWVER